MMQIPHTWRLDVASVFSQLAYISIPESVSEDVYHNRKLSPEVKKIIQKLPEDTQRIIDKIPGLEEVGQILSKLDVQYRFETDDGSGVRTAASILKVAIDYDYYEQQGHDKNLIVQTLKSRNNDYDPKVTGILSQLLLVAEQSFRLDEVPIKRLEVGMRLAQDLRLDDGFLVASSGADIDLQLLKVIRNYDSCYDESPFPKKMQVTVPLKAS